MVSLLPIPTSNIDKSSLRINFVCYNEVSSTIGYRIHRFYFKNADNDTYTYEQNPTM